MRAFLLMLFPVASLAMTAKPIQLPDHDPHTMVVRGSHERTMSSQGWVVSALIARHDRQPIRVYVRESECGQPHPSAWAVMRAGRVELQSAIPEPTIAAICRGK